MKKCKINAKISLEHLKISHGIRDWTASEFTLEAESEWFLPERMIYVCMYFPAVKRGNTEFISELTPARFRVIKNLRAGMTHPDDIAKALKITRQAVDYHLQILCDLGLVSKGAMSEDKRRPRVSYEITDEGQKLLDGIENAVLSHPDLLDEAYKRKLRAIDDLLLDRRITEEEYRKRVERL